MPVELPLTEPCPQCGMDMEPRGTRRRGGIIYVCSECGYEMPMREHSGADEDESDDDR